MAKSQSPSFQPPPTELIIPKAIFKQTLEERIEKGQLLYREVFSTFADFENNRTQYHLWDDYNSEYLKQSFNNEHNEYKSSYDQCADFVGFRVMTGPETASQRIADHKKTIEKKVENLQMLLLKSDLLKSSIQADEPKQETPMELTQNIFIVHGHDDRAKLDVARTISQLGLNPIILSEQPNQGQTIIEKFELHSNVGFAVILLTCDDVGKGKTESEDKFRARQNVVLEMGYFIGKLGRSKVFPLHESGLELPSDLHGILYVPLDIPGAWKLRLARELKAAGYSIDMNSLT